MYDAKYQKRIDGFTAFLTAAPGEPRPTGFVQEPFPRPLKPGEDYITFAKDPVTGEMKVALPTAPDITPTPQS